MPRPGNSQHSTTARPHPARTFAVRFVDGAWQVQQGKTWRHAREISILAAVITSPSGVIYGSGVVTRTGPHTFAVTP